MISNLEERTSRFGYAVIKLCKETPLDTVSRPLIAQLIRSATSVGANYMEASQGSSKKDFINKIRISKKEASESKHWLRMIAYCCPEKKGECRELFQEAHELVLIFGKISSKLKN